MIKRVLLRILLVLGIVLAVLVVNYVIFQVKAGKVTEGEPIGNRDPNRVALLVIDIQEGTTGSTSALQSLKEQSEPFIKRVNEIIEEASERDQLIVYIRTEVANPLINVLNNTMARGTIGAELDQRLLIQQGPVVVKRRNDPFLNTNLDQILTDHEIGTLVLTGLDAAQCIKGAVLAAQNRGYNIAVVEDGVISGSEDLKSQALDEFTSLGVEIIPGE